MKYIISGTNRPNSRTLQVSQIVQKIYRDLGEEVEIIDLREVGLEEVSGAHYSFDSQPAKLKAQVGKILTASGIIIVCPEYNGSMPGVLKYFLDHWKFPECYEYRPICLIGLGGRWGGLRPVEHLQQILGFRNAFLFPERVFITDIFNGLKAGVLVDAQINALLINQAKGFQKFVHALLSHGLDANSVIQSRRTSP